MKIEDVNLLHISYNLHYIMHVCILDYCITIIYLCVMGKQTRKMWWYQTKQTQKFHFFRVTTLINIQGGGWGITIEILIMYLCHCRMTGSGWENSTWSLWKKICRYVYILIILWMPHTSIPNSMWVLTSAILLFCIKYQAYKLWNE